MFIWVGPAFLAAGLANFSIGSYAGFEWNNMGIAGPEAGDYSLVVLALPAGLAMVIASPILYVKGGEDKEVI